MEENQAIVIVCENNFWGRSIAAVSASTDPVCRANFGPYTPGFLVVPYDDDEALELALSKCHSRVAAVMLEPIQGMWGNENINGI